MSRTSAAETSTHALSPDDCAWSTACCNAAICAWVAGASAPRSWAKFGATAHTGIVASATKKRKWISLRFMKVSTPKTFAQCADLIPGSLPLDGAAHIHGPVSQWLEVAESPLERQEI